MGFIKSIKQKYRTQRENEINDRAESLITVIDFAGDLYVAYGGIPLIPIDRKWTSKEILDELSLVRQNYVNSQLGAYMQNLQQL
jgi:hypothetical protein